MKVETTFQKFDTAKRIVYGVVLEPFRADSQGDWASDATIEKAAHEFTSKGYVDQIDLNHDGVPSGARIVESFIARAGDSAFPKGAWIMGAQNPEHVWSLIQAGEINGFSIYGRGSRVKKGLRHDPAATHEMTDLDLEKVSEVKHPANRHHFAFQKGDQMNSMAEILSTLNTITKGLEQFNANQTKLQDRLSDLSQPRSRSNLTKAQAEILTKRESEIDFQRNRLAAYQREYERIGEGEMGFERRDVREQHVLREIRKCEVELEALGRYNQVRMDDPSRSAFFQRGGVSTFLSSGPIKELRDDGFGISRQTRELRKSENDIDLSSLTI